MAQDTDIGDNFDLVMNEQGIFMTYLTLMAETSV